MDRCLNFNYKPYKPDFANTLQPKGLTVNFSIFRGRTRWAKPGQLFSDGCGTCTCIERDIKLCTLTVCRDTCSFRNWDGAFGHVRVGRRRMRVKDEERGCGRKCICARKRDRIGLKCNKSCVHLGIQN